MSDVVMSSPQSIRARLMGPPPKHQPAPRKPPPPVIVRTVELPVSMAMTPWRRILHETCNKYQVAVDDVLSATRTKRLVVARHEVFYRLNTEAHMGLGEIGRRFERDHTSVRHAVIAHRQRMGIRDGRAV